ncbi:hypothetical protein EXIGLDRAFT_764594 [Exidia glandulosa HHB12029]|uniref:Uncharacterized protein n=1 Tax=Exidia glandulosa HHB12029 TaxID=1314781 RepID=A0A165L3Q1_EXIGL|nr:hypothetical protein EXIGLDRAFT_764594 [Exidia glandulosa HHB12029]
MSAGPSRAPSSASSLSPISPLPSPLARPAPLPAHWETIPLPPPGPEHFAARRAAWLEIPPDKDPRTPTSASRERARIEQLLRQGKVTDETWRALKSLHTSLMGGSKLKSGLAMADVVKLLHAGWQRDGTWPPGAEATEDT